MKEVKVLTLIVTGFGAPSYLVLKPLEKPVSEGKMRIVPVSVGPYEALGLGSAIEGSGFTRPMTHDLMLDAFTNLDARVEHVLINDVKGGTFFARLCLSQHGRLIDLDARPSDAIALALRQDAPIYMNDDVLESASFPYLFRRPYDEDQVVSEFKSFLEDVSPDDFLG